MPPKRKPASSDRSSSEVTSSSLDVESLREIVQMLETSDITRLSWKKGDERLLITRGPHPVVHHTHAAMTHGPVSVPPVTMMSAPAPVEKPAAAAPGSTSAAASAAAQAAPEKPGHVVTSPFVGTFYRSPAPDQPAFVEVGSVVKKGQVLCIVEAMKLMNEIEAEVGGKVVESLVENGQPVEFGQALFRIEPA
jgi:acetyl-CoA carboxylase biotin carboxyl carrier protein